MVIETLLSENRRVMVTEILFPENKRAYAIRTASLEYTRLMVDENLFSESKRVLKNRRLLVKKIVFSTRKSIGN